MSAEQLEGVVPQAFKMPSQERVVAAAARFVNHPLGKVALALGGLVLINSLDEVINVAAQEGQSLCEKLSCHISSGNELVVKEIDNLVDPQILGQLPAMANCTDSGIDILGQPGAQTAYFPIDQVTKQVSLCDGQLTTDTHSLSLWLDKSAGPDNVPVATPIGTEVSSNGETPSWVKAAICSAVSAPVVAWLFLMALGNAIPSSGPENLHETAPGYGSRRSKK